MRKRRTKKEQTMDQRKHLSNMAEHEPRASAARQMIHAAYCSYTVDEYIRKREGETSGQEKVNAVPGTAE